jgi:hypothetical protein
MPESKRHPARRPQQRTAKPGHRNPAGPSSSSSKRPAEPGASPARRWLLRRSAGPLVLLHRLPSAAVVVALVVLLLAGLAVPWRWAGILLLVIGAFLGWLLALSWPVLSTGGRVARLLAVLALLVAGVLKLAGVFQ